MAPHQRTVDSIIDPQTISLIQELSQISKTPIAEYHGRMLLHFLQNTMFPHGAGNPSIPISKEDLDTHDPTDSFVLRKKVGQLENELYSVCVSLSGIAQGKHIDTFHGTKLYTFLPKVLLTKVPRKKARRWGQL
ncbi:MAG TPA: hypothetical protein VGM64_20885 [Lacunisphaera sp.]|jgi:hypothetical protein